MNRRALRSPVVAGVLSVIAAACDDGTAPPSPDYVPDDEPAQGDDGPGDGEGNAGGEEGGGGDAAGGGGGGDGPAGGGSGTETPVWGNCDMDPNGVYVWFQDVPPKGALQGNWFLADLYDLERPPCLIGATPIAIDQEGKILGHNDGGRVVQLRPDLPKTTTAVAMKNDAILVPRSQCTGDSEIIVPFPDRPGAAAFCDGMSPGFFLDTAGGRLPIPAGATKLLALGTGGLALWSDPDGVTIARDGVEVARFKLPMLYSASMARADADGFMIATDGPKKSRRLYTISRDGQQRGEFVQYPPAPELFPVPWVLPAMGPDGALYAVYDNAGNTLYRSDPGATQIVQVLTDGDTIGDPESPMTIQHVAEPITGG